MKKITMKARTSNNNEFNVSFIYKDNLTICVIATDMGYTLARGTAKLNPEDFYDVVLGERIAFSKALGKYTKKEEQRIRNFEIDQLKVLELEKNALTKRFNKMQVNYKNKQEKEGEVK